MSKKAGSKASAKDLGLLLDDQNANRGTERGAGMLEHSLRTFGAGRSALADKNGRVIAGNKTIEQAEALGIPLEIVETDGKHLVVVKRTDLDIDSPAGRALAIADNRVAELNLEWDPEVLRALGEEGVALEQFWFPDELSKLLAAPAGAPSQFEAPNVDPTSLIHVCPRCGFKFGHGAGTSQTLADALAESGGSGAEGAPAKPPSGESGPSAPIPAKPAKSKPPKAE